MSIFDAMFEFSSEQDISQAEGSVASTNILDFQDDDLNMGAGTPLYLNVSIGTEAFCQVEDATDGACTLVIAVCNDSVAPIDGSSVVLYETKAFTETETTAGAKLIRMALPVNCDDGRILGLYYTIGGATSAKGTINAWLDNGPQSDYHTQVSNSNI